MRSAMRFCFLLLLSSWFMLPGCTCKPKIAGQSEPAAAPKETQVNLAIWANYISEETVKEFTKQTGIQLTISNYSSNEELLAKIQAGGAGFDVIVPSDYMVSILRTLGLIDAIELPKIKNLELVDPRFLNRPYDPGNQFSVPYTWTVTGMAVNRDRFKGSLTGWADVFASKELEGKFSLLDDSREVLAIGLRLLGHTINSTDAAELEQARQKIAAIKSKVKAFTSEPMDALVSGEVAVAQVYSSDALQARKRSGGKVEFIFPKEGGTIAVDNLVIPKNAPHPNAANVLINFLLSPAVTNAQVSKIMSGPILKSARNELPAELQKDTTLFPGDDVLKSLEMMQDVGDAASTYDRLWTELKAM